MSRTLASFVTATILLSLFPFFTYAFPFGGQANIVRPCYNQAIYVNLGPPRGGPYVWTTGTKTYQYGPPSHVGQWILGLASVPYYCIISIQPVIVWPGTYITMMGSSGASAPAFRPTPTNLGGSGGTGSSGALPTGLSPTVPQSPSIGHVVISEVYYGVDAAHGSDPANEWVELYNGSNVSVNISGWVIADSSTSSTIPNGYTMPPNTLAVIVAASATKNLWPIALTVPVISVGATIGNGLAASGDEVVLKNTSQQAVDAVSWGTDTRVFNPAPAPVAIGHSLARKNLTNDTNTVSDWIDLVNPTPGK